MGLGQNTKAGGGWEDSILAAGVKVRSAVNLIPQFYLQGLFWEQHAVDNLSTKDESEGCKICSQLCRVSLYNLGTWILSIKKEFKSSCLKESRR